jgi:hypothetical protein
MQLFRDERAWQQVLLVQLVYITPQSIHAPVAIHNKQSLLIMCKQHLTHAGNAASVQPAVAQHTLR